MGARNATGREKLPGTATARKKTLPKRLSAKKISPSAAKSVHKPDRDQPYHHGDLHEALLQAAKRVAERDGINGLTLRAGAREAGVSHAAPSHHFGPHLAGAYAQAVASGCQVTTKSIFEVLRRPF